jgi:hypothetical protein
MSTIVTTNLKNPSSATNNIVLNPDGSITASGLQTFPVGTLMLFQQTSAPTGWTKQTTHNNKALRVVSGAASFGGTTGFTSVFTSRTPTGTVDNTTLTTAQIPSHTHSTGYTWVGGPSYAISVPSKGGSWGFASGTGAAGGGGAHNHGFTGTAMDFAVQYVDLIIASKD